MEQSIKMDDLGVALFEETPIAPMHRILYWTYPPFAGNFHWNFHFFWGGNRTGYITKHTVGGRNPEPVDRWCILLCIVFRPCKVVQDFLHPQYHQC